ncbi:hypothetical protein TNCV_2266041 [Trichonephila clavipes]|nr:hypothetical protein TNCV_2266041 [Trichonephila clavipes]
MRFGVLANSTPPPGGGQGLPISLSLSPTSCEAIMTCTRGLDGYLEYPHATKVQYIYQHPCLLPVSNPGPTAPQLTSITTVPDRRRFVDMITTCNEHLHP